MKDKVRILQSVGSLGVGGNEIFVMNFFRHINKDKFQVDFVTYDDSKMDFYEEIIFTSKEFASKNPKLVKDFYSATIKGWEYAFENIEEVAKLIYEKYKK